MQARLVEKLSGVPYEQYAKEHVLAPLGMSEPSFYVEPARQGRRAAEYQLSDTGVLTRTPDEQAFGFSSKEWPMDPVCGQTDAAWDRQRRRARVESSSHFAMLREQCADGVARCAPIDDAALNGL